MPDDRFVMSVVCRNGIVRFLQGKWDYSQTHTIMPSEYG